MSWPDKIFNIPQKKRDFCSRRVQVMSTISLILYCVALALMLGGICYYILVGSKDEDLNPFKAVRFIATFVLLGMLVATIAVLVQ